MGLAQIHPTAIIEPGAVIGQNVVIEAYAIVKQSVILEDGVTVKSYAYIDGHTRIGEGSTIWPYSSIGAKPQDLKYRGEKTYVIIGKRCEIREFVTINASCGEGTSVVIGDDCLVMAYCHIAHNCQVGSRVIMANNATLAGHVIIEDHAIIGGMTPIAQHVRVGAHSMVGGMSRVTQDIPPFTIGGGDPYKMGGLNLIGLKRRKFSLEERNRLAKAFKLTYRSGLSLDEALFSIKKEITPSPCIDHWIEFCRTSRKGLIGFQGRCTSCDDEKSIKEESKEESLVI